MNVARDICSSYDWIDSYSIGALQSVLSHNDEPTPLQASSLASSKENIDLSFHRITEDINSLDYALQLLRTRRCVLKSLSVRLAGALSTFRRLPNEILLQIFLHAYGNTPIRVACLHEGSWKLRAVCQKWANIVENCSQLWCNMVIDITRGKVDLISLAQAFKLCGSRPILMKLSVKADYMGGQGNFPAVLDTIVSSSQKWHTLSIESHGDLFSFVLDLFPHLERKLPLLQSLKLRAVEAEDEDSDSSSSTTTLTALLTAPMLENVHIELHNSALFGRLFRILPIPCQQIRRLSCNLIGYELNEPHVPLFLLQEKFPLLKRCAFMSRKPCTHSSDQLFTAPRVKHDGVVHLATSRAEVLNAFSFPALRAFSVGSPSSMPTAAPTSEKNSAITFKRASDMLSSSGCSLVSLTLSYAYTLVDEFLHILDIVPTLKTLDMHIAWCHGTARDEVLCKCFAALGTRRSNSSFSLLPDLEDLRLVIAAPDWITHDDQDYLVRPYVRHEFRFVSQVFGAITERSKYPSDFGVFSFMLLSDDESRWCLADSDIERLRDLKSTRFLLEGPRSKYWKQTESEQQQRDWMEQRWRELLPRPPRSLA